MPSVIIDCDLMKFPNSGLYSYCENLGKNINEITAQKGMEPVYMYLPPEYECPIRTQDIHIRERTWHKFYKPFLKGCKVWHLPFQNGRMLFKKAYHPSIKVVLTIHDLNSLHEGKTIEEQQKSLSHTQRLIDRADALVFISEFVKNDVIKNCNVEGKPLHVIYNGGGVPYTPELMPNSYKPKRPFLFGIGYINKKKNYLSLLPILLDNPELELVVSGRLDEPDYVKAILDTASEMGISNRVKLTGPISNEEKAWYLSNCYAFMHPSLAEGFGLTVIEAMGYAKPVFLSNKTSLPEIGGKEAFYFETFEPEIMQKVFKEGMDLYHSTDLKDHLIARSKLFDWKKSAAQYLEVYQSLLN